jgi:histone H3/H4
MKKGTRAGLSLPPVRIRTMLQEKSDEKRKIGEDSYIVLTAIVEAIVRDIMTASIDECRREGKKTVGAQHLYRVLVDPRFDRYRPLYDRFFIAGFGYVNE